MAEIIGVRFKKGGKIYYFRPTQEPIEAGSYVVVETARGTECGEGVMGSREISEKEFGREVKPIIRVATKQDLARVEENKRKAKRAFDICQQKIKAHGLAMNLLEVEYTFDNSKIVFNFSAEGRVDFRELVRDLAGVFRARIELRQIGVRDEAKMLGGLGICGRPFCCKQYMGDFQSVSIKMAKEQGLSLNPVKISGTCGRLMCCLKHEQDTYEELMRMLPAVGAAVSTPEGDGVVVERELVAGRVKVRMNSNPEGTPKVFKMTELDDGTFCFGHSNAPSFAGIEGYDDKDDGFGVNPTVTEETPRETPAEPRRPRGGNGPRRGGQKPERAGEARRGGNREDQRNNHRRDSEGNRAKNRPPHGKGGKGRPHTGKKPDGGNKGASKN